LVVDHRASGCGELVRECVGAVHRLIICPPLKKKQKRGAAS
jgi:hypothetical protein